MSLYGRLVRDILHPLDRQRTGDGAELRYYREFQRTQFFPAEELRAMSFRAATRLIAHAYAQCPFYRKQFDAAGLVPGDVRSLDDFQEIPVLEKRHIQQRRHEMVAANWNRDDLIPNQTGGSTGAPVSFFLSHDRLRSRAAATRRHNSWAGYEAGDKIAVVWGAPRDVPSNGWKRRMRNLILDRALYLDTANITEEKLKAFHLAMKRFRPAIIQAYAKSLTLLARYLKCHGLQAYQPRSIITSAEVLEPDDRALAEEVFGCPVFDRYGCREVSVIASECSRHDGLHIMAEGLHIEVVCGDRPANPGELGAVLVTDLLNLAMPLIRYRIGDMASLDDTACPCGRGLPRLKSIGGRITDFLVGSDGRLVSGVFLATYIVAHRPGLGQVQLWQEAAGEVLYKILPPAGRPPSTADLQFLATETRRHLGEHTKIEYEFVEELPAEASGKFLFSRSTAASDFLDVKAG